MSEYNPQGMQMFPPGVKNLLIINVLMFLAAYVVKRSMGVDLDDYLALHAVQSSLFQPWQYITYMFMHGGIDHILFNMFALWMFGYVLENFWGTTRFVIFYNCPLPRHRHRRPHGPASRQQLCCRPQSRCHDGVARQPIQPDVQPHRRRRLPQRMAEQWRR